MALAGARQRAAPRSGGETRATEAAPPLLFLAMPRFYLHLWDERCLLEDREGVELSDLNAAVLLAKKSLGEMVCHDVMADRDPAARRIVVADEEGRTVADVSAPPITVSKYAPAAANQPTPTAQ
jgi:hypothetical protein